MANALPLSALAKARLLERLCVEASVHPHTLHVIGPHQPASLLQGPEISHVTAGVFPGPAHSLEGPPLPSPGVPVSSAAQ